MKMYFKMSEFLKTDTGLPNEVKKKYCSNNLKGLMITLNVVRALVECPITVTSGYRSREVNEVVGGVGNSFHLFGRAADITCDDIIKLYDICQRLYSQGIFVECIYYPEKNIIHVAI